MLLSFITVFKVAKTKLSVLKLVFCAIINASQQLKKHNRTAFYSLKPQENLMLLKFPKN